MMTANTAYGVHVSLRVRSKQAVKQSQRAVVVYVVVLACLSAAYTHTIPPPT